MLRIFLNLYKVNWKICRYPDIWRVKILDNKEFQNAWNYYLNYDFNLWFFKNYKKLFEIVPLQFLMDFWNNENSDFADAIFWTKDSYLSFVTWFWTEKNLYSAFCLVLLTLMI